MSATRHYTLEELQQKQAKASQRQALLIESAKRAAVRERALKKKIARQEADERSRRLQARGEMLERLIENASLLTDAQVKQILTAAFGQDSVRELIAEIQHTEPSASATTLNDKEDDPDE